MVDSSSSISIQPHQELHRLRGIYEIFIIICPNYSNQSVSCSKVFDGYISVILPPHLHDTNSTIDIHDSRGTSSKINDSICYDGVAISNDVKHVPLQLFIRKSVRRCALAAWFLGDGWHGVDAELRID
jgi:hypothetical protein